MSRLLRTIDAVETNDGDGVKIRRIAGRSLSGQLDPFLMLDEINSDDAADYVGGFPEHPHRGFETITYMKAGRMRHRDHMGNEGVVGPGDVQWMAAGRGVIHSEMPEQQEGLLHGFQIWLNLPASEKMLPADYQDIQSSEIPEVILSNGNKVRAIAGNVGLEEHQLAGPLPDRSTQPTLLDVELVANTKLELRLNSDQQAFIYVCSGSVNGVEAKQFGVFSKAESLSLNAGDSGSSFLVLAGHKIGEPIAQHGPFVMNTVEQIGQAITDYQNGELI